MSELSPEFTSDFFGFLKATVQAPPNEYIGLLPIKYSGRLVCPGGTFEGFFFSEELRFALKNGYKLLNIGEAWSFQRGENTFKDLITRLNQMKVDAQLQGKPVLRSIAKLLMNSMYGRFGMHTPETKFAMVTLQDLNSLIKHYLILDTVDLGELLLVSYALDQLTLNWSNTKDCKEFRKYQGGLSVLHFGFQFYGDNPQRSAM